MLHRGEYHDTSEQALIFVVYSAYYYTDLQRKCETVPQLSWKAYRLLELDFLHWMCDLHFHRRLRHQNSLHQVRTVSSFYSWRSLCFSDLLSITCHRWSVYLVLSFEFGEQYRTFSSWMTCCRLRMLRFVSAYGVWWRSMLHLSWPRFVVVISCLLL